MTGYGKSVLQLPTKKISIEIKSLNSKSLDLNARMPSMYRAKELDIRTTVYKREMDAQYNLKSKSARSFFHIVNEKYPTLPFSIRGFEDLTGAKIGVKECVSHDLMMPYPVLSEKAGEIVAQFKCTIAVQPKSVAILCGGRDLVNKDGLKTDKKVGNAELAGLIASDLWKKEEKKKEKK